MKTSLRSGSNLASLEEIFDSQLVLANQKNDQEIVWTDKNQLTSDQIQEQASWLIAQYRVIDIYQINNYHEQSGSGSTKHIRLLLDKE